MEFSLSLLSQYIYSNLSCSRTHSIWYYSNNGSVVVWCILLSSIETISPASDITSIIGIVTSVEPTSGRSSKYIVNKYINYFCQLDIKQPVLIITTSSAVGIVIKIIVIVIIVIVIVHLRKKRHEVQGKHRLILGYINILYIDYTCSIDNKQDYKRGNAKFHELISIYTALYPLTNTKPIIQ